MAPTEPGVAALNQQLAPDGKRRIIGIGGQCEWGKCTHCALGQYSSPLDLTDILAQLEAVEDSVQTLCLYTAGSIWKAELEPLLPQILARVSQMSWIKTVVVESRPEWVTAEHIRELESVLPGKQIEIGVGLDQLDNGLRQVLGRGEPIEVYNAAMQVSRSARTRLITYVALGCIFLSEDAAIYQATVTSLHAVAAGTDLVSIEPLQIQEGTLIETLHQQGKWQLPWNWSLVEVVRRLLETKPDILHQIELRIGGEVQYPIPTGMPSNRCAICNTDGRFLKAFRLFNQTQDFSTLLSLECECRSEWLATLAR